MSFDFFVGGGSAPLPTYAVELWSDSSTTPGEPGSLAHTLTPPSALNTGVNTFTAMGDGIDLNANTTYHMVWNNAPEANTRTLSARTTEANGEDGGAAEGWSIANRGYFRAHDSEGSWSSPIRLLKIAVRGYAKDTVIPTLSTAAVEGSTLTLTYDEALDAASVPAASAFTVTVDGSDVSLASSGPVAVDGSAVVLTLAAAVTLDQTVTVSYAVPSTNPVQDEAGNDAAALAGQAVATPPIALSLSATSVVEGGSVTVTANLGMAAASDTTVTVSAAPGPDTTTADFTLSATTTLTIAAGQTASTGTVSIITTDNDVDHGARSVTVSATATGGVTDAPAPGPPTGVMATAGDGELEISWDAPADDGGSPVTGYQLRYTSDGGASYSAAIPAAAPPHRLAGLDNGTTYAVEVRAVNAVGPGDWSAGASGTPEKPDEGRARRLERMEELKDSAVT